LLKPVAEGKPCGEDFTYHPSLQQLETIARGKPETQFSPAEEPQWKEVRDAAISVGPVQAPHGGSDSDAVVDEDRGHPGFPGRPCCFAGITERYWSDLYPKLDPEDNNDPTERLNILNNLSSAGEPFKFVIHVRRLVLCDSPAMGRITLQQILTAKEKSGKTESSAGGGAASTSPDLNQIQAAFREAGSDAARATLAVVDDLIGHAQGIENFLDSTLGVGRGVNFESLDKLLSEMKHTLEPYAGDGATASDASAGAVVADMGGASGGRSVAMAGPGVSGTIRTRGDVIKAWD
jgi:type VI secretion system protein ImpA